MTYVYEGEFSMGRKYFIFPANYMNFNFDKLFKESCDNRGNVLWERKLKDPKDIKIGDVCYIYYSNLPDGTARIMLRGTIASENVKDSDGVECYAIKELESINWDNSRNPHFTREILFEKYGIKMNLNKRQLKDGRRSEGKNVGDEQLREKLEDCYEKGFGRLKLADLEKALNKKFKCAFDSSSEEVSECGKHPTFKTKYGLNYFEIHHLFQQHICKENDEFFDAVNDEKNLIFLCPTCHKKIHYGQKDVVRKMLATLYNREKKFYDSYFANYLGSMDVLEWLYKIYKVSEEK